MNTKKYIKSCIFAWIIRAQMSGRHRILPNRIFHIEFVWNKTITLIQNNTLWHPLTYTSTPRLFVFSKIIRCNRIWKAGLTTQGFLSSQVYWNPLQAGITPPLQTKFHRTGRGLDRRFIPTRELACLEDDCRQKSGTVLSSAISLGFADSKKMAIT